ncbi:MAG: radical SAM protein [Erysipelotrichaceae bacterium]
MRFKRIYIEIINTCNLKCSFCVQNQRKPQSLSVEEFEAILKQVKPYTNYIYLHVLGEPLAHPQLSNILSLCFKYQMQVNLTTNGTLLKKQRDVLKTARCIRQINVSLHSFSQDGQVDTQTYLKDVIETCDCLSETMYVSYRLWNIKDGAMDQDTQKVVQYLKSHYQVEEISPKNHRCTLAKNRFLNFEEVFEWPSLNHPLVSKTGTCLGMKTMCAILVDGSVVPCCLDGNGSCVLGNIHNQSFKEIIESDQVLAIENGFNQKHVIAALCQRCTYRGRFD